MALTESDIVVPAGKVRERLDVFLTHHVENATRSKVQQAIRDGYVRVNGEVVKPSHQVSPGEVIHISLPRTPPPDVLPEHIPLDVVYEDEYLLVINKPAGMVTHPAYKNYSGTLVNALLYYSKGDLSQVHDKSHADYNPPRPGIVHRLDKDTTGLIVVAKDDVTHAKLAKQFSDRTIEREYWALVWGLLEKDRRRTLDGEIVSGRVEASLGRSKSDRKKIAVTGEGKTAITDYSLIEEFDYLSLVRCKLHTGRTHQIRVHMHHIGHPIFGDPTYGGRKISWGGVDKKKKDQVQHLLKLLPRQALHAKTIGFKHPKTGKEVFFDSSLPPDMQEVLSILRTK